MANEEEISRHTREMLIESARRMRKSPTESRGIIMGAFTSKAADGI